MKVHVGLLACIFCGGSWTAIDGSAAAVAEGSTVAGSIRQQQRQQCRSSAAAVAAVAAAVAATAAVAVAVAK